MRQEQLTKTQLQAHGDNTQTYPVLSEGGNGYEKFIRNNLTYFYCDIFCKLQGVTNEYLQHWSNNEFEIRAYR